MADTMTQRKHINRQLDQDLDELKTRLLAMGTLVDQQVTAASSAFSSGDLAQVASVVDGDDAVNQLERVIDERCLRLLALWQPEASDLRFVAAALKIVTDLERIGDLAVSVAEQVGSLEPNRPRHAVQDLNRLVEAALDTLRRALRAFVDRDEAGAQAVISSNRAVKTAMRRLTDQLRDAMRSDPALVSNGLATISAAKHVERIAAHATNIAEMVVYIARGEDVRHLKS
jgi:phosphate transport system protein